MTDTTTGKPEVRDFAAFLMDRPETHAELSQALQTVITAVADTGKKGSLTLTVSIGPFEKDVERLIVDEAIKLKLPEHDRRAGIFFRDRSGNLTRHDPNVLGLFTEAKDIPAAPRPDQIKEL